MATKKPSWAISENKKKTIKTDIALENQYDFKYGTRNKYIKPVGTSTTEVPSAPKSEFGQWLQKQKNTLKQNNEKARQVNQDALKTPSLTIEEAQRLNSSITPKTPNSALERSPELRMGKMNKGDAFVSGMLNGLTFGAASKGLEKEITPDQKLSYIGGNIAGSIAPIGKISKAIGTPIANKYIQNTLGRKLVEGALTGATYDTLSGIVQGDDAKGLAKRVGEGAVLGGALDLGLHGAGKLIKGAVKTNVIKEGAELSKGGKSYVTPKTIEIRKNKANLDEYLNNLEYQDYVNNLDPNYVRNENAFRNKVGGKLTGNNVVTKVVVKKERIIPDVKVGENIRYNGNDYIVGNINGGKVGLFTKDGVHVKTIKQSELLQKPKTIEVPKVVTKKERVVNPDGSPSFKNQVLMNSKVDIKTPRGMKLKKYNNRLVEQNEYVQSSDVSTPINTKTTPQIKSKFEHLVPKEIKKPEIPQITKLEVSQPKQNAVEPPKIFMDEAAATSALKEPPQVTIPQPKQNVKVVSMPGVQQGSKNRQFVQNSILNSDAIPQEMKENINIPKYEPISNVETMNKALSKVNSNPDKAMKEYWENITLSGADDVALGESLITKAIKEGRIEDANRITADLAEKLTRAGQTVQAASMMKRMTPEGFLMYAQRQVKNINKGIDLGKFKGIEKIELTKEDSTKIIDFIKKAQTLEGREKDKNIALAAKIISDKAPKTVAEKVKGLQIMSMLANPKSMVRNVLGNTIFGGAENISNIVGAGIDKVISKRTGVRTTLLPNIKGQGKSLVKGVRETLEDSKLGIDTSPSKTQYEIPNSPTFKKGFLGKVEKATGTGLQLGDRPFYQAAYDESLRQQMKIAGVEKPTQEMIEKASKLAEYRTYQDINQVTGLFQMAQDALNTIGIGPGKKVGKFTVHDFGIGNVVLPFPKTPANILARSLDYSPAGMFKVVRAATKDGFDQKTFVDSLSRTLTGSGAILLGYKLAKNGVITGQSNKDKDVANLEKQMGKGSYAFNTTALKRLMGGKETEAQQGDKYRTYDWAQPISIALAIGADMYNGGKSEQDVGTVVIDALRSGGTTLFNQSLLQGLQRFMGGYSPIDNFAQTAVGLPSQFVPSLLKQGNQMGDGYQRETYDPNIIKQGVNLIKAKAPGLSLTLPIKYDTLGQPVKQFQGKNNPYNVMINPGFTTSYNPTDVQQGINKIYQETGNKNIFPKVAPKSFKYKGETINLTPKQMSEFQKYIGEETNRRFKTIINSGGSSEYKAKELQKILDKIYDEGKAKIVREGK